MKNMGFKVKEKERLIVFKDGTRETFRNVTEVDAKGGDWLRIHCDVGYVLLNPANINFIIIPLEAKVR